MSRNFNKGGSAPLEITPARLGCNIDIEQGENSDVDEASSWLEMLQW